MIWNTPQYNGGSGEQGGGNCAALVNYLDKDHTQMIDACGREMDEDEINEFVRESKSSEMQRDLVFSPEEGVGENMSDDEMSLRARATMNEYLKDKPEADYCMAVHRDTDKHHVQVAMHGNFDSVKMFSEQFDDMGEAVENAQWAEREEQIKEDISKEQRQQAEESQSDGLSQSLSAD
jgi:hypothetical protein